MMARRMDPELFRLSRDYVGDTAETIALAWETSSLSPSYGERVGVRGRSLELRQLRAAPHPSPLPASGERERVEQADRNSPRLSDIVAELALIDRNALGPRLETWLDAPRRHRPLGAAQAADRRAARRRLGAPRQDRRGRDGRLQGRRRRAGLARAQPALRAAVCLARRPRAEARRVERARVPPAHAVAPAGGHRLGRARLRRSSPPNGNGTASACRSWPATARPSSIRAPAMPSARPSPMWSPASTSMPCSTASCWCCARARPRPSTSRRSTTCSSASTARPSARSSSSSSPPTSASTTRWPSPARTCARCPSSSAAPASKPGTPRCARRAPTCRR